MLLEHTLSDTIRYQKTPRFKSISYITLRIMTFKHHVGSRKSFESISYLEEQYLPQSLSQMSDFKSRDKNDKQIISFSLFTLFNKNKERDAT